MARSMADWVTLALRRSVSIDRLCVVRDVLESRVIAVPEDANNAVFGPAPIWLLVESRFTHSEQEGFLRAGAVAPAPWCEDCPLGLLLNAKKLVGCGAMSHPKSWLNQGQGARQGRASQRSTFIRDLPRKASAIASERVAQIRETDYCELKHNGL
jgi:hypothetical protein